MTIRASGQPGAAASVSADSQERISELGVTHIKHVIQRRD